MLSMNVISLTTIPPRLNKIEPTLRSLLNQDADISEVRLNIPKRYRRSNYSLDDVPCFPNGVRVVLTEEDFGPATKVLPTVLDLINTNAKILFCDDDHIYPRDWASTLLAASRKKPNCCIVLRGYDLDKHKHWSGNLKRKLLPRAAMKPKDASYRIIRSSSLGLYKPARFTSGYVDILMGYGGVLLQPNMIPSETFDIPDHIWTVDDPWLSSHLTRNGIPIWLQAKSGKCPKITSTASVEALLKLSHRNRHRDLLDIECISYFKNTYGMYEGVVPSADIPQREAGRAI